MKKTKILTVLGVLLAMGITACGGKTASKSASGAASGSSNAGPASGQTSGKTSSSQTPKHEHVWAEDTSAYVAPGCETEGQKTYRCTGEGTCPQNNVKTEKVAALGHDWGTAIPVAASNGGVSYNKYECQRNNKADKAVKYDIDLTGENRITLVGSSALKADSNVPGYIKLDKPNGGSFTIDFYSDAYGVGKIYQNGVMDHMSGSDTANQSKSFFSGNDTGNTHADEIGNFELKVNGEAVDFSAQTKSFGDLFPEVDDTHPAAASTYSPLAEIETGAVTVGKGLNQISFKRVDSYNIILKSFVIVFVPQEHEHTLSDTGWTQTKAPSCLPGEEAQQCSVCKATITRAIPATGAHTLGEWIQDEAPSCKAGLRHKECSVCHEKFYEAIDAVTDEHTWGAAETINDVFEDDGTTIKYVGYEKQVCSVCGTWKVVMSAAKGTLGKDSSLKEHSDLEAQGIHGYKLNGNNQYFEYKFNFATRADITVYQRGAMDNFTSNGNVTYYTRKDGKDLPNFQFDVNGVAVDLSAMHDVKAKDVVKTRADDDPLKSKNYSTFEDILIGESQLVQGDNTFRYTRLESYNYIITDIVLLVTPRDHAHEAGANWINTDPDYHWKNCTHNDGYKMEKAKHTFGEWTVDQQPTEDAVGSRHATCSVCGYIKVEEMARLDHDFQVGEADANGVSALACKNTGCTVTGLQFNGMANNGVGNNSGALSSGKLNKATTMTWSLTMPKAGQVTVLINAAYSSGNGDKAFTEGWAIKGGASADALENGTLTLDVTARADSKLKEGNTNYSYLEIGNVTVTEGAFVIAVTTYANSSPARLLSDGLVRVIYA